MLSTPFSPSSSGPGPIPMPANGAGPRAPRPGRMVTVAWIVVGALSVAGVSLVSARAMHAPTVTEAAATACQPVADDACACLARTTERLDDEVVYVAMGEALRVQAPRDVELREAEQRRLCGVTTDEDTSP